MKKKMVCAWSGALLCSILFSGNAFAIEPEPVDSLIHLKGVVVSANKIQSDRNSIPLSISVVERSEIEASSESALLPVLSERVPGLFVTEKGITGFGVGTGSAGTVNIRGVGQGNKVLMLFDGQPQWAGVFGHSLPDTYVASDVDRVEVIRGPGSLLYGSNAMGGVVNIITRKQKQDGRRTQARLMYGSYNTQKYLLNNGYKSGAFSSFVSVNHDRTDGHRPDSKFHITNGFANAGYELNEHYKVGGDISLAKIKTQNPGTVSVPMVDNIIDALRGTASVSLTNSHEKTNGALQAFYNWGVHDINDGYKKEGGSPRPELFNSKDHNTGILLYQSFRLFEGNSFTAGIDYKNWGGHTWYESVANKDIREEVDKTVNETAGYITMQQSLFDKLSLNAGLRYEHSSAYGNQWTPQAGLTFRPIAGNTIRASYSQGYRSPNIRELYISYGIYNIANKDLKPESMETYELSVGQHFLDNKLYAELTGFYIDGKNLIQSVQMTMTNIDNFHNKGIEFEASYYPLNNLSFTANYSYLHTNKILTAAPKHKFFAEASYTAGRFTVTLDVQSIADLYLTTPSVNPVKESYTLLNSKVSYKFGQEKPLANLFVKGENLTASRYSMVDGFPMPKATVMAGIDITF
ncbi:Outer membrane cobalamin translocator [Bacteroidales bacterium Barb4]|nr:Outer membrane cobalamin translocator [Bacteroidales bacterium Barb4]